MSVKKAKVLQQRKSPTQARSAITIDAVLEATVQVVLQDGIQGLTTTRIARRAGFAVGTVYQYYANKSELLYALARRHLDHVVASVEAACERHHGGELGDMVVGLVDAFVTAKVERAGEVRALHLAWSAIETSDLVRETFSKLEAAVERMLRTTARLESADLQTVAFLLTSTLVGATRSAFEQNVSERLGSFVRTQLVTLCRAYIASVVAESAGLERINEA